MHPNSEIVFRKHCTLNFWHALTVKWFCTLLTIRNEPTNIIHFKF